jgi:hypothetical protein
MLQISDADFAGRFQRVVSGRRAVAGGGDRSRVREPGCFAPVPLMVSRFVGRGVGDSSLRTKITTLRLLRMPRFDRRVQISHGKAQERLGAVRRRSQMMAS